MDDPRWLRLITIGLVLAALAVGYFLLTGRLSSNNATKTQSQVNRVVSSPSSVLGQNAQPSPSPTSAYERIVNRTKGEVQTLPKTGFPIGLAAVFSISAIISGWSLRKYPY